MAMNMTEENMKTFRIPVFIVISVVLMGFISGLYGDIIEMKNGLWIKGRIIDETEKCVKLKRCMDEVTIRRSKIKNIIRSNWVIKLKHGIHFTGKIIRETLDELEIETPMRDTPVKISKNDIISCTEKGISRPALAKQESADPYKLMQMRQKALEFLYDKKYKKALVMFGKILMAHPEDMNALYNVACTYSLMGEKRKALAFLKNAVDWGFIDFAHIESDPDLNSIRELDGYKELIANRTGFIKHSQANVVEALRERLLELGVWIDKYKIVTDPDRMLSYIYNKPEEKFQAIRTRLDEYAEAQWKHLFRNKPGSPIYIVMLSRKDTPKVLSGGIGGMFNPATNILFCGDSAMFTWLRSNVVMHEFTHALHWGDMNQQRQAHPIWLTEGLASLFESSSLVQGKAVPVHSYRLTIVQQAVNAGRHVPWKRFISMNQLSFMRAPNLCYAQARYMFFYMYEKGLLRKFYDEYTNYNNHASDTRAAKAFESVFGKPIENVENDWIRWVNEQEAPEMPFLGIAQRLGPVQVQVGSVVPGSAADTAGMRLDDIIISLDGTVISNWDDFLDAISTKDPGDLVEILVLRNGKQVTLTTKLGKRGDSAISPRPAGTHP